MTTTTTNFNWLSGPQIARESRIRESKVAIRRTRSELVAVKAAERPDCRPRWARQAPGSQADLGATAAGPRNSGFLTCSAWSTKRQWPGRHPAVTFTETED